MRLLTCIFIFFNLCFDAQDKLLFRDGSVSHGELLSVTRFSVYFKDTTTMRTTEIRKENLVLAERTSGTVYLFSSKDDTDLHNITNIRRAIPLVKKRNLLGVQPFGIFTGRATLVYEHVSANGNFGLVLPFSLTFKPFHSIYNTLFDSLPVVQQKKFSYIIGADLNWYAGSDFNSGFFIGPRLRYGTDILLQNMEAWTLQTQLGWRFGATDNIIAQHVSIGYGFARILSTALGRNTDPSHTFGWFSVNYRLSLRW